MPQVGDTPSRFASARSRRRVVLSFPPHFCKSPTTALVPGYRSRRTQTSLPDSKPGCMWSEAAISMRFNGT